MVMSENDSVGSVARGDRKTLFGIFAVLLPCGSIELKGAGLVGYGVMATSFCSLVAVAPWRLVGPLKPGAVDISVVLVIFWVQLDTSVTGSLGCLKKCRGEFLLLSRKSSL